MRDYDGPTGDWSWPVPTRFGAGRVRELAATCAEAGMARPLVVLDPGVAGLPSLRAALGSLPESRIFDAVRGNPDEAAVAEGVRAFKSGEHDGIVAIGGGSALDTGKAIALLAHQTRPPVDFAWGRPSPRDSAPIPPVAAVPTTAGTGSEFSPSAVIVEAATPAKRSLWHPALLPRRAILDPALTLDLPRNLTIWTGLDALIHNIEAYLSPVHHPMADALALSAIARAEAALPRVVDAPGDVVARGEMLLASAMGAAAFDKGLGAVHALSHAVSAVWDTHHGLTNAVLLPHVLAFNREAAESRMADIARALGLPEPSGAGLVDWAERLCAGFTIPASLRDIGVRERNPGRLARGAMRDPNAAGNPRALDLEAATRLLNRALEPAAR